MSSSKNYSSNFNEYREFVVHHDNYKGIPFTRKVDGEVSWIATKTSVIGKGRIDWAKNHAIRLGIPTDKAGWLSKVMYQVHPTKEKPCQTCGNIMSLNYAYPNGHLINAFIKEFGDVALFMNPNIDIFQVCETLIELKVPEENIKILIIDKLKLSKNMETVEYISDTFGAKDVNHLDLNSILTVSESVCRERLSNMMGPGAMSNFPDRLDGFHSYNRCCRDVEDSGRWKENMQTYNKDRRAYEYWSDGNIHAANKFMNSSFFNNTSADHIGPISLGFKHESIFMQRMSTGENSAKRDRISHEDIEKLISIESKFGVSAVSWYSEHLWQFIKSKYRSIPEDEIRQTLKENLNNYMKILWNIKRHDGIDFLSEVLISSKVEYFNYNYSFDDEGKIVDIFPRKLSSTYDTEIERLFRVSLDSLDDYNNKENRNLKFTLNKEQISMLENISIFIDSGDYESAIKLLHDLMFDLQNYYIQRLSIV